MSSQPPLTLAQRRANAMALYGTPQSPGWNPAMGGTAQPAPAPGVATAPPPGIGVLPRLQPPPPAPPVAATAPPMETGGPLGLPVQQRPPGLGTPAPGPLDGGVVGPPVAGHGLPPGPTGIMTRGGPYGTPPVAQPSIPSQSGPPPAAPPIGAPAVGLRRQQATAAAAADAGAFQAWHQRRHPRGLDQPMAPGAAPAPGAPPPGDERLRRRAQELALSQIR